MPPKRVGAWEEQAWEWINDLESFDDIHETHELQAYLLNKPPCPAGTCKVNCPNNPRCLNALGEAFWQTSKGDKPIVPPLLQAQEQALNALTENIRPLGSNLPVGLKNLGSTCYLNSILQVLFSNVVFRNAILTWRAPSKHDPSDVPIKTLKQLQGVFAELAYGRFSSVDPHELVHDLVVPGEQQDIQEFASLFYDVIERGLQHHANVAARTALSDKMSGRLENTTECSYCGYQSRRPEPFVGLEVALDNPSLLACLSTLGRAETLTGANRYHCSGCGEPRDATRRMSLTKLPDTLHLQLLRFVYDRATQSKKKLSVQVSFPDKLDLNGRSYVLRAVVLHKGSSASAGHYITYVRRHDGGEWFELDDDHVTSIGPQLRFAARPGGKRKATAASPKKTNNGGISAGSPDDVAYESSEVYLVVYNAVGSDAGQDATVALESLPDSVRAVAERSAVHAAELEEQHRVGMATFERERARVQQSRSAVVSAWGTEAALDTDCYLFPASVLRRWVKAATDKPTEQPPATSQIDIINTWSRCPHGRVPPMNARAWKAVSPAAAALLWTDADLAAFRLHVRNGGPDAGLCRPCVAAVFNEKRQMDSMKELAKRLTDALARDDPGKFLIDKAMLRDLARGAPPPDDHVINSELACPHGHLLPHTSSRSVSAAAWRLISARFPDAIAFSDDAPPCTDCSEAHVAEKELASRRSTIKEAQRLYLRRIASGRSSLDVRTAAGRQQCFLVSAAFLDTWRAFLEDRAETHEVPAVIDNASAMLCEHGGLRFDVAHLSDSVRDLPYEVVVRTEWKHLEKRFRVTAVVSVRLNAQGEPVTDPPACEKCAQVSAPVDFEEAEIVVRRVGSLDVSADASREGAGEEGRPTKRARRVAEHEIKIARNQTVKFLKMQLTELFPDTPTLLMRLAFCRRELADDSQMLRDAGIGPGSIVYLHIASQKGGIEDAMSMSAEDAERAAEIGFAGTALAKAASQPGGSATWACRACTFLNGIGKEECEVCGGENLDDDSDIL